jgi:DNA-binding MarR family transcriptional regulator
MLINRESIAHYLSNTLGMVDLDLTDYSGVTQLPYLLQDQFEFLQMQLANHCVILVIPKKNIPLRQMRDALGHLPSDQPLVMCFESLASYERRYLIEQKISFLVPGNQLYILDLGIDLREYFYRKKRASVSALNPATQAMLLWFLQNHQLSTEWAPSEAATTLKYTSMTASRAATELVELGLFEEFSLGRRKYLRTSNSHEQIWQKAKPYLRSPVKQEIWTRDPVYLRPSEICLAGISALSKLTMINSDKETCYALSPQNWQELKQSIIALPEKEPGASCYQIWAYEPRMYREGSISSSAPCVDTLSLWLSFRDSSDPRIELALSDLEKEFRW